MKKILLASTILVGTAGVAAAANANFTFSGKAYVGIGYSTGYSEVVGGTDANGDGDSLDTWGGVFGPEISSEFKAGMMTTTDMGLEAGAAITVAAAGLTFDDDYTSSTFGYLGENATSISESKVYLSGDWGKLTVTYDANGSGAGTAASDWDVVFSYDNTWGDFAINAYYTMAIDVGGTNGDLGASASYSFGDYSVYVEYDWDNSAAAHWIGGGADASFGGFSAGVDLDYNITVPDLDWKADASYTTGAITVGVTIAEDDGGVNWGFDAGATASYDLGGGVAVEAQALHDDAQNQQLFTLGVSMAF